MSTDAANQPRETRAELLRRRTEAFCAAFLDLAHNPPDKLLREHFTASTAPRITEHGPAWAAARLPFVGRTFTGREACLEYFDLLGRTLECTGATFPDSEGFVVDGTARDGEGGVGVGVVTVAGKARFGAVATGQSWDEDFIWRLSGFSDEGLIGHWEIWADPLSAWVAVGGEKMG